MAHIFCCIIPKLATFIESDAPPNVGSLELQICTLSQQWVPCRNNGYPVGFFRISLSNRGGKQSNHCNKSLQIIHTVSHSCIHSNPMHRGALILLNIWNYLEFHRIIPTRLHHPIQPPCYIPWNEMPLEIMQASCVGASAVSFELNSGRARRVKSNPK